MNRPHRRQAPPAIDALERRCLLAGSSPAATWIGQDGHDLVGYSSRPGGNGVQDIHIALTGLPADRTITAADVAGLGGGDWQYAGPPSSWLADIVRAPGATAADLYIEPYQQDSGRPYNISLTFDDGSTANFWVTGGPVDPNLRMPQAALQATWIGQDGHDLTGAGPGVGPDGIQDAHLTIAGLSTADAIAGLAVAGPGGEAWQYGPDPQAAWNAELAVHADDPSKADLYLAPPGNLNGQTLTLTVIYASGKTDAVTVVAGPTDPASAMPAPAPVAITWAGAAAWLGQDGRDPAIAGAVHVALAGLPAGRTIVAATLSDEAGGAWAYGAGTPAIDPNALPLAVNQPAGATNADLFFAPDRDETGSILTARLLLSDGTTVATRFAGGAANVALRSPAPASTSVQAQPGADLNALANQYGAVHLAAGTYALSQPLILNHPVTITADPGATLVFSQGASDPAWTAAIKIHAGNTTLEGFAVRFATPIRWSTAVDYGPAVIGSTDNLDGPGFADPMAGLVLTRLDLQSPPAASSWEEAPRLIRLATAANGVIAGNTLRGGTTEVTGGPWQFINNTYNGTVPGTYTSAVFAGHYTHDVVVANNTAQVVGASGKTWRFLTLTQSGFGDTVAGNRVTGIGPLDTDTVPNGNSPEIMLAEAYRLHYEGDVSAISADGRVLQIPPPQGGAARTGDVVAILSGPDAGQYRRIAQAIDAQTYLMDDPLPQGSYEISIATGFVGETYEGNTVDARGSSVADPLVLAGDEFGTQVINNTFMGGDQALRIVAPPTEAPDVYGWSHAPVLGLVVDGNTLVDSVKGGVLSVLHDATTRPDEGRVYLSATLADNVVRWSTTFLGRQASVSAPAGAPRAFTIGDPGGFDPGDLQLTQAGNGMDVPPGTNPGPALWVNSGTVNGRALVGQGLALPTTAPAATGLALVNDTGSSQADGITRDGRVEFLGAAGAVAYAYRVGNSGPYLPATPGVPFLPAGLVPGTNSIAVHAVDASGRIGPDDVIAITLDTLAPTPAAPALAPGSDSGSSARDGITNVTSPTFAVQGNAADAFALLRNGTVVATRQGPGNLQEPARLIDGTYRYSVTETDPAGNAGTSAATAVTIDTAAPAAVGGLTALAGGQVQFRPIGAGVTYAYALNAATGYVPIGAATTFTPAGLTPGVVNTVRVRAVDVAGNVGPDATVRVAGPTLPAPAAPSAIWIGQDGHDFAGTGSVAAPDGHQDVQIALAGLPAGNPVKTADLIGMGGGEWQFNGRPGSTAAVLVQAPGATTADLYFQPTRRETGRYFVLNLRFADGSFRSMIFRGGAADPALPMPTGSVAVAAKGQPAKAPVTVPRPVGTVLGHAWAREHLAQLAQAREVAAAKLQARHAEALRLAAARHQAAVVQAAARRATAKGGRATAR